MTHELNSLSFVFLPIIFEYKMLVSLLKASEAKAEPVIIGDRHNWRNGELEAIAGQLSSWRRP